MLHTQSGTCAETVVRPEQCDVCGGRSFEHTPVLWPRLIADWNLSRDEARYIDVQQGTHCLTCGANIRSIALARAIMRVRAYGGTLAAFVEDRAQARFRLLEINHAGTLHPYLAQLPRHRLASYPEVDMRALPMQPESFDMVVHSDTLEHVPDPGAALAECRRVLAPQGALVFTVPIVVGRVTRSRTGLDASYHGHAGSSDPEMLVRTEFGSDVWTMVLQAGFAGCELVPCCFPSGVAVVARK
jgi:SAM-dependent methyltransferase